MRYFDTLSLAVKRADGGYEQDMPGLSGEQIGPYQIMELIGHGGMSDVYKAIQPNVGREVAIKLLPAHFLQDRTFLERFKREVRISAQLQHPRILPVYDFGEHNGQPYIVAAYLSGGTLADRISASARGMPLEEVVRLTGQIAEGLDFAHEQQIIHRDFKPSNVLFDARGNVHLSDFGIARAVVEMSQLTGSGPIGTPYYMAPEMSQSGTLSSLVDIYALGVTLYQMLTGDLPFRADTPVAVLLAHMTQPVPDMRRLRPDMPAAMAAVVLEALAKDPAQRTPRAGVLAERLSRSLGEPVSGSPQPIANGATPSHDGSADVYPDHTLPMGAVVPPGQGQPAPQSPTVSARPLVCPSCGSPNALKALRCVSCGHVLGRRCPVCNTLNTSQASSCSRCGTKLK